MGIDINCYGLQKNEPETNFQNNNINNNKLKKSSNSVRNSKNEKEMDFNKSQNNNKDVDKMGVKESKGSFVL